MMECLQEEIKKATKLLEAKYKDSLHQERYQHILGVAAMAKELAENWGENPDKAYLAGLLHDYYKYESKEEMAILLTPEEKCEAEECPVLYHSYASARFYLQAIGQDIEIFNAIKYHVYGRETMTKLEEILVLSDYVEINRKYENCIYCRHLVERALYDTAIYESTRHTIQFLAQKHVKPALGQLKVLNFYKEKMKMELLSLINDALGKVKAANIITYDMKNVSPFYDYMMLASVNSLRQAESVSNYIEEAFKETPFKIRNIEGEGTEWVLIDCYDVVLSVFTNEERNRLDIEKVYLDIPRLEN